MNLQRISKLALAATCGLCAASPLARADDVAQWGRTNDRNLISLEKNPPTEWEVGENGAPGKNIKWSQPLGSQSYGNPIVANGIVWVGTNNEGKRDPKFTKDGGVLMAFRASDGKFLWQDYNAKLEAGRVNDWPLQGNCSNVFVEGGRMWYTTSRCEVACFEVSPLLAGDKPKQLWRLDMMKELGVFPHNMTSSSILAHGDLIYVITGNGVDDTHKNIPAPEAPALIAINKNTGKVVWQVNPVGDHVLHGQWASPSIATVNGKAIVIAPLGDGWVYSYEAETGKPVWQFDSNRKETIYPTTRNELIATPVIYKNRMYIANGQDPEHGEGVGHLWCVDITKTGDISKELPGEEVATGAKPAAELLVPANVAKPRKGKPNPNSGVIWDFAAFDANGDGKIKRDERMNRTISTVAIYNGLVFAADFSGFLHCLDAENGKLYWTYDMQAAMWGSPLVVDGKVYLGDEDGDIAIFEAQKEKAEPIAEHNMGGAVHSTPVFSNGVMYVMTDNRLFAIQQSK